MTDILPPAGWPNVRQLETNEFATGGANGNMNEQAKSLAARSELLKKYAALPYESKTGGYALNERVQLATGDIVRSTIPSNVNNPNENMTGWVKTNSTSQIFDESGLSQQEINNGLESIADLATITTSQNGSRVYVKSYYSGQGVGGGTFIYDSAQAAINNGISIFNGWVRQFDKLTFEMGGVKTGVKTDQSASMQLVIDFAEANGIKEISFAGNGDVYLSESVIFKPRLKNGTTSTYWGYGVNRLVIDPTGVMFKPLRPNFTMFKFHRDTLTFKGVLNISNGKGTEKYTGVRAYVMGMTKAEYDAYNPATYFLLGGFFSAEKIYISGLETGAEHQAGYYNYYGFIDELVVRDTNYAVTYLSPTENKQDQNTRMTINNLIHEGGFCTIYGECMDNVRVLSGYNEGINISVYSDTRSLIPDGIATGIYIPEKDKWGFVNPYNVFNIMLERNDRPVYNKSPTSSIPTMFSRPTGNVLYPNTGFMSNGFEKSTYPETVKKLNGIVTSGTAATYGVVINPADTTADPTIKNDFPITTLTELYGTITYLPSGEGSFATFNRTELLYVLGPAAAKGWWSRVCKNDGTSTGVAWVRVGSEYVDSVAAKLAATTLTSAITTPVGLRGFNWDVATDKPVGLVDYMMGLQAGRANVAFEILTTTSTLASNNVLKYRRFLSGAWQSVATVWSSANTTVDANGFVKSASPIVKLFSNHVELNEEAALQPITFERVSVGHYLIKGSTGLADDGWWIEVPIDTNGNKICAVEYQTLKNGDIEVKTFKHKFDIETALIIADINNPIDIPENSRGQQRWIDIRLNQLTEV